MTITEEKIQQYAQERYRNEINEISGLLEESLKNEGNARISEDNFVNVFLPFFANEENLYNVGLGNWITVATANGQFPSGQFREVDVVDDAGRVLYSIPPVYDREAIKPKKISDKISYDQLIQQAEKLGTIKPSLKTKLSNQIFTALLNKMKSGDNKAIEYLTRWNDIFIRYNRPSIFEVEKNTTDQSSESGETNYEIEEL